MDRAILDRTETGDQGTFGRLEVMGHSFFTGELPWRGNRSNVSCIPQGLYECSPTFWPKKARNVYEVKAVKGRFGILIHSANYMGDTSLGYRAHLQGCIALGEKIGWLDGQKAVLFSTPAIRRFEALMCMKPFLLEVKHVG